MLNFYGVMDPVGLAVGSKKMGVSGVIFIRIYYCKRCVYRLAPCGRGRDQKERVRGILQFWGDEYLFGNA